MREIPIAITLGASALCAVMAYGVTLLKPIPTDHFRYKMTVVAQSSGTEISKSGVIGVDRAWSRDWLLRRIHKTRVDGEAILIEFESLPGQRPRNIVVTLRTNKKDGQGAADRWPYWGNSVRGAVDLGPAHYPEWERPFSEADGVDTRANAPIRLNDMDASAITGRTELPKNRYPLIVHIVTKTAGDDIGSSNAEFQAVSDDVITPDWPSIRKIIVEPTDMSVTHDLSKQLPWVANTSKGIPRLGFGREAYSRDNE